VSVEVFTYKTIVHCLFSNGDFVMCWLRIYTITLNVVQGPPIIVAYDVACFL
jgi:hypothetical protein